MFSLYIDPLLLELKHSGISCHINGTYMGVLSYAYDITLSCPRLWGLNDMLKIGERFSAENSILFNKKKTICIKFGSKVKEGESAILDSSDVLWTDNVVHLSNYINSACNDDVDCNIKKCFFIGYVNKLMANYGRLQTTVLINLFNSYCCCFYGSHLWKFNFTGFDKCCKSWNIVVRKLLHIPFNTHVCIVFYRYKYYLGMYV